MEAKGVEIPTLNAFEIRNFFFKDSEQKNSLHPPSNFFYISRIENFKDSMKFPLLPHRKTVFDFEFITHGSTARSKGLDSYKLGENTFFFLPAYQISMHEQMSEDSKGFYCHFELDLLQHSLGHRAIVQEFSFLNFASNPVLIVPEENLQDILNILHRIEKEFLGNHKDKYEVIKMNLLCLFVELRRFSQPDLIQNKNAALRITQQYKNALIQFIYEKTLVSEYADLLSISPNHLQKCVKSITGKSAHTLLDEMVLLESKVLLKQSALAISDIAFKIGKQDPSDFARFFKSKTGYTPTEYRGLV